MRRTRRPTEGLGVVLLEAMNYHLPVIASGLGGITDIVLHEKTGLLVPQRDPQALADALLRIADDPALAARLAEGGHQHAQRNFSWDVITDRWEECYADAVEK
jgi:glycosyltransferase involved in cell wall biosynthesis